MFDGLFNEDAIKKLKKEEVAVPASSSSTVPAMMTVAALLFAGVAVWVIGQLGKRPVVPTVTPMPLVWLVTLPATPQETPTLAPTATASAPPPTEGGATPAPLVLVTPQPTYTLLPTYTPPPQPSHTHTPLPPAAVTPQPTYTLLPTYTQQHTPLPPSATATALMMVAATVAYPIQPQTVNSGGPDLWLWGLVAVWFLSGVAGIFLYYRLQNANLPIVVYPSEPVHSPALSPAPPVRIRTTRRRTPPAPPSPTAVARIITHPPQKPVTVVVNTGAVTTPPVGDSPVPVGDSPVNTGAVTTPSPVNDDVEVVVGVVGDVFRFPYRGGWAEVETPFQSQSEPTAEQVAAVQWLAGVRVGGIPVSRNFVIGRFFRSRGSRPAQFVRKCLHANSDGTGGG